MGQSKKDAADRWQNMWNHLKETRKDLACVKEEGIEMHEMPEHGKRSRMVFKRGAEGNDVDEGLGPSALVDESDCERA